MKCFDFSSGLCFSVIVYSSENRPAAQAYTNPRVTLLNHGLRTSFTFKTADLVSAENMRPY